LHQYAEADPAGTVQPPPQVFFSLLLLVELADPDGGVAFVDSHVGDCLLGPAEVEGVHLSSM
jgi:hypothetical protein